MNNYNYCWMNRTVNECTKFHQTHKKEIWEKGDNIYYTHNHIHTRSRPFYLSSVLSHDATLINSAEKYVLVQRWPSIVCMVFILKWTELTLLQSVAEAYIKCGGVILPVLDHVTNVKTNTKCIQPYLPRDRARGWRSPPYQNNAFTEMRIIIKLINTTICLA